MLPLDHCDLQIMNTYRKIFNPENPGIMRTQFQDFGIGKIGRDPRILDPGIAIPRCMLAQLPKHPVHWLPGCVQPNLS